MSEWWKIAPFLCVILGCHRDKPGPIPTPAPDCLQTGCPAGQQCLGPEGSRPFLQTPGMNTCQVPPTPEPVEHGCDVREDGGWIVIEGAPKLEATRDLVRNAQSTLGDTCGRSYVETVSRLVRLINEESGGCAGAMGEDGGELFVRIETGPELGYFEQWHPAHSGTGCMVTGPQKGVYGRKP